MVLLCIYQDVFPLPMQKQVLCLGGCAAAVQCLASGFPPVTG